MAIFIGEIYWEWRPIGFCLISAHIFSRLRRKSKTRSGIFFVYYYYSLIYLRTALFRTMTCLLALLWKCSLFCFDFFLLFPFYFSLCVRKCVHACMCCACIYTFQWKRVFTAAEEEKDRKWAERQELKDKRISQFHLPRDTVKVSPRSEAMNMYTQIGPIHFASSIVFLSIEWGFCWTLNLEWK